MQTKKTSEFTSAQDYIEYFRQGEEYYEYSLPGLLIDNRPDPKALRALGEELATGTREVRRNIVKLLDNLSHFPLPGIYELRDPAILALLFGPGFAKADIARSEAMRILKKYASPATLFYHKDLLLKVLKEDPEESVLCLISKAKVYEAREEVERLSKLPEWNSWSSLEAMRVARAALGDTKIEDEYLAQADREEVAGDAKRLTESLHTLAHIGTPRSLQALCRRMMSPLIVETAARGRESVRLTVMDALLYVFPGEWERLLKRELLRSDEDYKKIERFCTEKTGVRYDGIPRPVFFTETPGISNFAPMRNQ